MASKSKRRRRVLGASCILAALIIAGSSFAWFTSKDEVTNRLTATANYGVSVVEDFTPPKAMVPGQEVNKDVSAVNTGNVDAFTRISLQNVLRVSRYAATDLIGNASDTPITGTAKEEKYYKTLTTGAIVHEAATASAYTNTNDYEYLYSTYEYTLDDVSSVTSRTMTGPMKAIALSKTEGTDSEGKLTANEVTTLQAGGRLIIEANKTVVPTELDRSGDYVNVQVEAQGQLRQVVSYDNSGTMEYYVKVDSDYYNVTKNSDGTFTLGSKVTDTTKISTLDGATLNNVTDVRPDYSGSAQYKPTTTGLYLFERFDGTNKYYSGYYYEAVDDAGTAVTAPGAGQYYALNTATEVGTADPTSGTSTITTHPYLNTNDSSGLNYVKLTLDANGDICGIKGLKLKTKTAMQDYTDFFPANWDGASAPAGANTNGYYTDTPMSIEFLKSDGTAATAPGYTDATQIKVTYKFSSGAAVDGTDIPFIIKLANDWATNWTYVAESTGTGYTVDIADKNNAVGYFYYKTPLEAGKTSSRLVDSVKLDGSVGNTAFADLEYDLNVLLDSIQVVYDANNNVTTTAAKAAWEDTNKDVKVASDMTGELWTALS